jgi:hypothetical protein
VIYFVQPKGRRFIKIGYARCVQERLSTLQICNPDELILKGVIPGGKGKEAAIHQRFARFHVRGEWFHYTRELWSFIQREAVEYQPQLHDPRPNHANGEVWSQSLTGVQTVAPERGKRISVWVQRFTDRNTLVLQWADPDTGRRRSGSSGTSDHDEAERRRADLEAILNLQALEQIPMCNSLRNTPESSEVQVKDGD